MMTLMARWRCWRITFNSDFVRPVVVLWQDRYYANKSEEAKIGDNKMQTLCASSTTRTFPVPISARMNSLTIISNKPHADASSRNGSERSTIVNWPGANRLPLFPRFFCADKPYDASGSRKAFSSVIRCSKLANWAGLNFCLETSNFDMNAANVNFSPRSRKIDWVVEMSENQDESE